MIKFSGVMLYVMIEALDRNGLAGLIGRSSTGLHTIISGIHRVLLRLAAATVKPLAARKESPETVTRTRRQTPVNSTSCDSAAVVIQRDFTLIARLRSSGENRESARLFRSMKLLRR